MDALYIITTGAFIALSCGLLGCFLILRKMAMIGDAISHAVLPGIALAYLFSGSRNVLPMLLGAAALGVLTTVLIEWLTKKAKLQSDASIGMVFTFLFALGIIIISLFADQVDLDQDCVLYGELAYVPLDRWISSAGTDLGPRSLWIAGVTFFFLLIFVRWGFKGLFITTFDEKYAASLGISTLFWHYALMSLVSIATVVSFESVGAILVVAFLIVPPATAYLLSHQFKQMLALTVLFSIASAVAGYYLAVWLDGSIAGAMSVASGVFFLIVFVWKQVEKRQSLHVPEQVLK